MLDIKFIRNNPGIVKENLNKRNYTFDLEKFLSLDQSRKEVLAKVETLFARQNKISNQIKQLLKEKSEANQLIEESKKLKTESDALKQKFNGLNQLWLDQNLRIPNLCDPCLPVGNSAANKLIREKVPKLKFNFPLKNHIEIGKNLDIIEFDRPAKITGSNFIAFKGAGAKLVRSLINLMIELHTEKNGYCEIWPPKIVNQNAMQTTGQLPNLEADMYRIENSSYYLIPTAEVPVTNFHSDEILVQKKLPLSYVAYTPCFRKEAGSYGKDTKGLIRVHEFDKVELVKITEPDDSKKALNQILTDACKVLDLLKLPYRVVLLSTGDISFASSQCYDIEVYSPGIKAWLEVSSCSNFGDFQARRGNIKYYDEKTGKNEFVHTLNGSGLALPRLIAAILENYQQRDGSVILPKPLRGYFNGRKRIKK